ncbi:hypothetical protein HFO69_35215 [Rhizobium laguerreae]|uniref:hypothetical protein n=1 Tax=Rhizobium laguerreae TaxID=1076926 RepID=UPI001C9129C6|nr:hypothetical protein [Rhizobium laguerreae]MBY3102859.1 hypothetical protein [Rhizobium laguerreae]
MSKSILIIDFQIHRLRHLRHRMTPVAETVLSSVPPPGRNEFCDDLLHDLPDDEPSLVAALVLQMSKRLGRSLYALPSLLRDTLGDLVAEGDPTARLLYAWIDDPRSTDQEILEAARQPAFRRSLPGTARPLSEARIYRHRRFWRPGSLRLVEADQRRIERLRQLLAKEISHDL